MIVARSTFPSSGIPWSALVSALMNSGLGTAIAYRDSNGNADHNIRSNPDPDQVINTDRIYVIVKPGTQYQRG